MNHDHDYDDNLLHHQLNILVSFEMSVAGFLLVQSGANLHLQIFRWILPTGSGYDHDHPSDTNTDCANTNKKLVNKKDDDLST